MHRKAKRQRVIRRQFQLRTFKQDRIIQRAPEMLQFRLDDRADRGRAPVRHSEQVMRGRQCADATFEAVGEIIQPARPPPGQRQDREHIGERVLDPVIEFTGQRIADRVLFFKERQPRLILERLLGQQPREQHQQARQRQPEHQRHHRQR